MATACRDTTPPSVTDVQPPLPASVARLAIVRDLALTGPLAAPATQASVLGHDAVDVEVDDVQRSVVGRFMPGLVRVTARIRVVNRLARARLERPTFPVPPTGAERVFLFVAAASALDLPAGVTTLRGNQVAVTVPGTGAVRPSMDWDGDPWDFIHGVSCRPPGATCARYEPFEAPVLEGGTTAWRTVGFDVEPTVRHLRLHLVLAADVANPR
jgi:hypothetical protein